MADLYAGPNTHLSKAFIFCGWETISVDSVLDSSHDLSNSLRQQSLHEQLQSVCSIAAALDCSTKSGDFPGKSPQHAFTCCGAVA